MSPHKKKFSAKFGFAAAFTCLALGAEAAQGTAYPNCGANTPNVMVVGGKGTVITFTPTKTTSFFEIQGVYPQSTPGLNVTSNLEGKVTLEMLQDPPNVGERRLWMAIEYKAGSSSTSNTLYSDTVHLVQTAEACVDPKKGSKGNKFFVSFMQNQEASMDYKPTLYLYATADSATPYTIKSSQNDQTCGSGTLGEKTVQEIFSETIIAFNETNLNNLISYSRNAEVVESKSLYVEAEKPISLYAYNSVSQTSDASHVIPLDALGNEYFAVSWYGNSGNYNSANFLQTPGMFLIVATENDTYVTITPAATTDGNVPGSATATATDDRPAGIPFTVKLNKGNTYLVKSKEMALTNNGSTTALTTLSKESLTGTHIKASKPIAVFGGHKRAAMCSGGGGNRDHLYEQLLPLRSWGKRYALVRPYGRLGGIYSIVAAYDETIVTITDKRGFVKEILLNRGEAATEYIRTATSDYAYIEATQPVEVVMYSESKPCLPTPSAQTAGSDPFMLTLSPIDVGTANVIFTPVKLVGTTTDTDQGYFLTVMVETAYAGLTKLELCGSGGIRDEMDLSFKEMSNTRYSYAEILLSTAVNANRNYSLSNPYGFGAYTYGYASVESVGFMLGGQYGARGEEDPLEIEHCVGDTPTALPEYVEGSSTEKYIWYENLLAWQDNKPLTDPPTFTTGSATTFHFYRSRQIGCGVSYPQSVNVTVKPLPDVDFFDDTVCLSSTRTYYGEAFPEGGRYTFADGTKTGQEFTHQEAGPGTHQVRYTWQGENGCYSWKEARVTVETLDKGPFIRVASGDTLLCEGQSVTLQVANAVGRTFQWYHKYSASRDSAIPGSTAATYAVAPGAKVYAGGTYYARVSNANGCTVDVGAGVVLNPNPDKPRIVSNAASSFCVGGNYGFYDDQFVALDVLNMSYQWYTTDTAYPISGANGYEYKKANETNTGPYRYLLGVQYSKPGVTPAQGCWSYDTTNITVYGAANTPYILPQGVDTQYYCEGDSLLLTASALSGSSYTYRWYSRDAYDTDIPLSSLSGDKITVREGKYLVESISEHGCLSAGKSAVVAVLSRNTPGRPAVSQNTSATCQGGTITITASAVAPDGYTASYHWFTVDSGASPGKYHNSIDGAAAPTYGVTVSGYYAARATVTYSSDGGLECFSSYSETKRVELLPQPLPPLIDGAQDVCVVTNNISLTASPAPGSSPVDTYRWYKNGIQITAATAAVYKESRSSTGTDVFTVKAISAAGCESELSASKSVTVWKPSASIANISGDTAICYGSSVVLTGATDAGGNSAYQWYKSSDGGTTYAPISDGKVSSYTVSGSNPSASETAYYRFDVTNAHGCPSNPSNMIKVTIYAAPNAPAVTVNPVGVCEGSAVTLSATRPSVGVYKWYFGGGSQVIDPSTVVDRGSDSTYTISDATLAHHGWYAATITTNDGCVSPAGWGQVNVYLSPKAPVLTYDKLSICEGDSAMLTAFSSTATYTAYEWYYIYNNKKNLYPSPLGNQAYGKQVGEYAVRGMSSMGGVSCWSAESDRVAIAVYTRPSKPTITTDPSSSSDTVSVCGTLITLTGVSPTAGSFQWYAVGAGGAESEIPGAIAAQYDVTETGRYAVRAGFNHTPAAGTPLTCWSIEASLSKVAQLLSRPFTPTIDGDGTTCVGTSVTLKAVRDPYDLTPPKSYVWRKNGAVVSNDADSFRITTPEEATYEVAINGDNGCQSNFSAVKPVSIRRPVVSIVNASQQNACVGNTVTLTTTTSDAGFSRTYTWYENNSPIGGATEASYTVQGDVAKSANSYRVVVVDEIGCTSTNSNAVTVSINPPPPKPAITPPLPVCEGSGSVTLTASSSGATGFQWFFEKSGAFDSIRGATGNIYRIESAAASATGRYRVRASNGYGCYAEADTQVVVYPLPPNPLIDVLSNTSFCTDDSAQLKAYILTADSVRYAWSYEDVHGVLHPYPSSADGRLSAKSTGRYSVRSESTEGCKSASSAEVDVTVHAKPEKPTITPNDAVISVCTNGATTISGNSSGATSYQWYSVGAGSTLVPINGATGSECRVDKSGSYAIRAYRQYESGVSCPSLLSDAKIIELRPQPQQPLLNADKLTGCVGGLITLTASRIPGSVRPTSYKWYNGDNAIKEVTDSVCSVYESGSYTVVAVNDLDCPSPASTPKAITFRALPTVTLSADVQKTCGEKITLSAAAKLGDGSPLAGGSYEWYENTIPPTLIANTTTSPNYVVQPNADPTVEKQSSYYLYVADPYGCRSEYPSNPQNIQILALPPNPMVASVSVCEGSDTSLTVSPDNAYRYKWYKRNGGMFDSIDLRYDAAYPVLSAQLSHGGQYAVEIINTSGCVSAQRATVDLGVRQRPTVAIKDSVACANWTSGNTASFASPTGGSFSCEGGGCTDGTFNPSAIHQSSVSLIYHYTAANGCSSSDTKTIEIISRPSTPVVNPPGLIEVCEDSVKVTLQAEVESTSSYDSYTYQWRKDGKDVGAETKTAAYIATAGGYYSVKVRNRGLCWSPAPSDSVVISVIPRPKTPLLAADKSQVGCVGDPITLTASPASGSAQVLSYRWYKNGSYIPYVDEAVYRVTHTEAEDVSYKVVAVGYNGCLSNAGAARTFAIRALPTVTLSAGAEETCGEKIKLSASATLGSGGAVSGGKYEWYEDGDTIKNATAATYEVQPNADKTKEKQNFYYVYVTDQYGCRSAEPSDPPVEIHILPLPPNPVVAASVSVCEGGDTSLTVSPAIAGNEYMWLKRNGRTFDTIAFTYDAAYSVLEAEMSNIGLYAVEIINSWGCVSAQRATVNLDVLKRPTASIVDSIACASWTAAKTADFALPRGGRFTGDGCEDGAFNPSAAGRDNAIVTYTYTASNGCSDYDTKIIEIIRLPSTPVVTPRGLIEVCEDSVKVSLQAGVEATPGYAVSYTYQWRRDGVAIPGEEAKTAAYVATRGGSYDVLACNRELCWNPEPSEAATVSVIPKPKAPLLSADRSAEGCIGDVITLTATPAPGSAQVLSYRWYKNNAYRPDIADPVFPAPHNAVEEASYTAVAVGYNSCLSPVSVPRVFTIHALPTVTIADGVRKSCGERITLSANAKSADGAPIAGSRYDWYENNDPIANAYTSYHVVQPNDDPTEAKEKLYYVYVTDQNGCKSAFASPSAQVSIHALPPNPIVANVSVCEGSDTMLMVSQVGIGDYRWLKRSGYIFGSGYTYDTLIVTHSAAYYLPNVQMSDVGTYAVEIISAAGCTSAQRTTVELNVRERPGVAIIETQACESWTTDHTANFASPKGGKFICNTGCEDGKFNPSDVYQGNAVLTYEYTASNGCTSYDTKTIAIVRLPASPIVTPPGPIEVCEDSVKIELKAYVAAIPGDSSRYTYQWRKEGFAIPGEEAVSYTATKPGYYDVLVCNQGLCWNPVPSDSIIISVISKPEAPLIATQSPLFCPGESTEIYVERSAGGSFQWYKGDSKEMHEIAGEISPAYSAGEAGQYAVGLFGEYGCWSPLSNLITVGEYPLPKLPEIIPSQAALYNGLDYTLLVKTPQAGEEYGWYKNDLSTDVQSITYPLYNLNSDDTGRYTVKVVDEHGCYAWSEPYLLAWTETQLFIPNIFTPNGDGINDYLQILGLESFVENKLEVVNKRGRVIFSQKNYQNRWDGEGLPNDVYYYVLNLKREDGTTSQQVGYVHLKR